MTDTLASKTPSEWAASGDTYDCSGYIGPLFDRDRKVEWPMYSFERPGSMLWNAIARGLHRRGWTDEEIKAWLQSKNPRWALDGELGDLITSIGEIYSRGLEKMPAQ